MKTPIPNEYLRYFTAFKINLICILFAPGVVIHEFCHVIVAKLFKIKIQQVIYLAPPSTFRGCITFFLNLILLAIIKVSTAFGIDQRGNICNDPITQAIIKFGEVSDNQEDKRKSLEIKQDCERMDRLAKRMSDRQEHIEILREMQQRIAARPQRNRYHDVETMVSKVYNISRMDAHYMIERNDPKVDVVWNKMITTENQKLYTEIKSERAARKKKKQ